MKDIKNFPMLEMNTASDQYILPGHYKAVREPHYKGDGEHSIKELQDLCRQFTEYCHQQALIKQELIKTIKS